jgi:archaellum biogenesis protein FlaJ (TadC family)
MVLFVLWVANYGISLLLMPILNAMNLGFVLYAFYIFVFLILNPLPEMIYQRHYSEPETLMKSVEFSRENVISWFVPNSVLIVALLAVRGLINGLLAPVGSSLLILLVMSVVSAGLISFGMIYRGYLFDILYKTTRRKRLFSETMYRN